MTRTLHHLFITLGFTAAAIVSTQAMAQLRIGQPSGFSGSVAAGVKENTDGARLYIDAVNARGGVNGQKIDLLPVDDKFDPKVTVEVARQLITEEKVLALFLNRGTPHAQTLLPLLAEYRVPLVAPSTGAMVLHDPVHPWLFNVRATYQREAAKAIEHLASIGITRMAVLQTDDSFGADSAAGAQNGFDQVGQKPLMLLNWRMKPLEVPAKKVRYSLGVGANATVVRKPLAWSVSVHVKAGSVVFWSSMLKSPRIFSQFAASR